MKNNKKTKKAKCFFTLLSFLNVSGLGGLRLQTAIQSSSELEKQPPPVSGILSVGNAYLTNNQCFSLNSIGLKKMLQQTYC